MSSTPAKSTGHPSSSSIVQHTLAFLNNASFALSSRSPSVSAHLSREISDISHELAVSSRPTVSAAHKFQVCESCGSIAVPGETSTRINLNTGANPLVKHGKHKRIQKRNDKDSARSQKSVRIKCLVCGYIVKEKVTIQIRKVEDRKLEKKQILDQGVEGMYERQMDGNPRKGETHVSTDSVQPEVVEKPLSRKQRQSRAKKESSLQSMLRKSKEREKQPQSGFGLGLMDLMKTGDET